MDTYKLAITTAPGAVSFVATPAVADAITATTGAIGNTVAAGAITMAVTRECIASTTLADITIRVPFTTKTNPKGLILVHHCSKVYILIPAPCFEPDFDPSGSYHDICWCVERV